MGSRATVRVLAVLALMVVGIIYSVMRVDSFIVLLKGRDKGYEIIDFLFYILPLILLVLMIIFVLRVGKAAVDPDRG